MLELVIKWAVPFLMGSLITFIGTLLQKNKALRNGLQCLLRAEIIRSYDKYTLKKEIPIYAKEALEKEYKAYHKLGGNDVATALYNEMMELPCK